MVAATPPAAGLSALVGANDGALTVGDAPVRSRIALVARPATAVGAVGSERVYLNLEGVKGNKASGVLTVVLTAPGGNPAEPRPMRSRRLPSSVSPTPPAPRGHMPAAACRRLSRSPTSRAGFRRIVRSTR